MKKISKKKKIIAIISAILVVALIVTVVAVVKNKNKALAVQFQTVGTQDISSDLIASADIEAGTTKEYKVETMAMVVDVFVKPGDHVVAGQQLATFDTSDLDKQVSSLEKQYSSTKKSYNDSEASIAEAKEKLKEIDAQIADLKAQIEASKVTGTTSESVQTPQIPQEVLDRIQKAVADSIASGNVSQKQIAAAIQSALMQAKNDGIITDEQIAQIMKIMQGGIQNPPAGSDAVGSVSNVALEAQLATLQIQRQVYELSSTNALGSTSKDMMNTLSDSLKTLKAQRDVLKTGWTAAFDGMITEVNVAPGQQTTLLKSGVVLVGTDQMTAVLTLGKYDLQKVTVGMPCTIKVVNGEFIGEVAFIAPTADGGSSSSSGIMDGLSSSLGISGLGNITGSTSGVRCEVRIDQPDEKVVIGLDATVEIHLGTAEKAIAVPVEALTVEKTGKYCFVLNEKTKEVEKRELTVGATSDLYYEVTSGLSVGEKIAVSELQKLKELTDKENKPIVREATTKVTTKK